MLQQNLNQIFFIFFQKNISGGYFDPRWLFRPWGGWGPPPPDPTKNKKQNLNPNFFYFFFFKNSKIFEGKRKVFGFKLRFCLDHHEKVSIFFFQFF